MSFHFSGLLLGAFETIIEELREVVLMNDDFESRQKMNIIWTFSNFRHAKTPISEQNTRFFSISHLNV